MNHLPDFLFLGTAKAGTTSLAYYLKQHTHIYFPPEKEFNFFAGMRENQTLINEPGKSKKTINDLEAYGSLFSNAPTNSLIGEAATLYLVSEKAPLNIYQHLPNAKLIAILRNPIDRAYSNYQYFRRDNLEPLNSFEAALNAEKERKKQNWHLSYRYAEMGLYAEQLQRYFDIFPKEQIRVYLYEDLQEADKMVNDVVTFLGLPIQNNINTSSKVNISGTPYLTKIHHFIKWNSPLKNALRNLISPALWMNLREKYENKMLKKPPKIDPDTRKRLINYFKDDILKLQTLLQRDLSKWLRE